MILTLCGSPLLEDYFAEANRQLTLAGHLCFNRPPLPFEENEIQILERVQLAKIEHSDAVVMLNIGPLNESSINQLLWARMRNKLIFWTMRSDLMTRDPIFGPVERMARLLINRTSGEWEDLINTVKQKQEERAESEGRLVPR